MKNHDRDLLVLFKTPTLTGEALNQHVECLHKVLVSVENTDAFCTAHQLATRMKITEKRKRILKAVSTPQLKPFYFLINKN